MSEAFCKCTVDGYGCSNYVLYPLNLKIQTKVCTKYFVNVPTVDGYGCGN